MAAPGRAAGADAHAAVSFFLHNRLVL